MITPGEYISDRMGLPYSTELNCWELTRLAQLDLFGRETPIVPMDADLSMLGLSREFARNPERGNWVQVPREVHGAIVMMSRPGKITAIHCGTYLDLDGGGVFHTDEDHGVTFDTLLELGLKNWVFEFYIPR